MTSVTGNRVGQRLGNYQLKRLIGQGGFAEVYLAEHIYLKTQAAVKVLQTQLAREDQEGFLNEARTIARLKHSNILSVLEFGVEQGTAFLVMDYAPGGSLRERYQKHTLITPLTVLPSVKQVAAALQYAHQENIVHRDVKPENMLLGSQGETLLSDFGMSLGTQSSRTQNMEDIAGTIAYMAPEQIQGRPGRASDQYSLGIVLYAWLSGDCPFSGSFSEIATQQVMADPPPIKSPAVSPAVEAVIRRALAKAPEQRFPNVQAFADAFEQATLEVEETLRAPSGWLPPGVHQQLQTMPSIEGRPTRRENSLQTTMPASTQVFDPTVRAPETARKRKRPARFLALALIAVALLVVVSGIAFLALNSGPSSAQIGASEQASGQTGMTVAAAQAYYTQVTSKQPLFTDPLTQNVNQWDNATSATRSCLFAAGSYHSIALAQYTEGFCSTSKVANLSSLAYQVQMTIVRGNEGGVFFRVTVPTKKSLRGYLFSLNRSGTYNLWAVHTHFKTLLHGKSAAIKPGLNQPNLLTVIARGKQIALYTNKQYIGSIMDDSASTGYIGVFAQSLPETTEVTFNNLTIWGL